jgi:hypothetical protein
MLKEVFGDCLTFEHRDPSKTAIVIHCCNNLGAWGSGFVIALNERFGTEPRKIYKENSLELGDVSLYYNEKENIGVYNIIGQDGVVSRDNPKPIRYDAIYDGCERVLKDANEKFGNRWEIHMPKMGSGLAQGNWSVIRTIVEQVFSKHGIDVWVYNFEQETE